MDKEQLRFVLEQLRFSADMPPDMLTQLAAACTWLEVSAGATVFREGGVNENLYLICSGRVALQVNVSGRGAVRILTVGPGEMVGWSSVLSQGKMTTSAVVVEDVVFVVAPAKKLRELSESSHEFGFRFMSQMADALSKRLVATRLQLLDLFANPTPDQPASQGPTNR